MKTRKKRKSYEPMDCGGEAEEYLVPRKKYHKVPACLCAIVDIDDGGPIGIFKHPEWGWGIVCSGQGPFVAYREDVDGSPEKYAARFWRDHNTWAAAKILAYLPPKYWKRLQRTAVREFADDEPNLRAIWLILRKAKVPSR